VTAACAAPPPPVAPTVTLAGPPGQPVAPVVEPTRPAEPAPAPKPAPKKATIEGHWKEEFVGRGGCSDSVKITGGGRDNNLRIEGADCNDGASYEFEDVRYDGRTLTLVLKVPQTGYVVRYKLSWLPEDMLGGEAEVTGSSGVNTYQVRWTR